MRQVAPLLLLVLGCRDSRSVSLIGEQDTAVRLWEPDATGGAELTFDDDACWVQDADPSGLDEDLLGLDSCVRLSPEELVDLDTGMPYSPDTGSQGGGGGRNPLCSFFNLIGATAIAGGPEAPAILYCDNDDDGGVRLARIDPQQEGLTSVTLAPGECWADPDSGAIVETAEGQLELAWVQSRDDDPLLRDVVIGQASATGELLAPMTPVFGVSETVRQVALVEGHLVWSDDDGRLAVTDLGSELTTELASGVGTVSVEEVEDTLALAWCALDDGVWFGRADTQGTWYLGPTRIADSTCGFEARPSVAATPEAMAVVWHDAAITSHLALAGTTDARHVLEPMSFYPRVSPLDGGWMVSHTTGVVERRDPVGAPVARAVHPAVALHEGGPIGLRVAVEGDKALFAFVGIFTQEVAGGHTNLYHYLEASIVDLGGVLGAPTDAP